MNFYTILAIFVISTLGVFTVNLASSQVDPLIDIVFLQTGELNTIENQFHISNEISIREFFNGNIIRVLGQTIEGWPYITYSKISDDKIDTHGMIFINSQFVDLTFVETQKKLSLNKTNTLFLIDEFGDETDEWEHKKITLYNDKNVMFKGKRVGGLRLRR